MKIGVQLYSVREQIKEKGLDEVLAMIRRAGYDCVEFAGFYGLGVDEVKNLLKKHGLDGVSAHISPDAIEEQLPYVDGIGIKNVFIPWNNYEGLSGEKYVEFVKKIKAVKPLMDERGINFGYHNHADEFRNGDDKVFELMHDVDGLTGELDIYWATAAGLDPVKVMEKYGKRLTALHIKDMDPDAPLNNPTSKPNAVIGEGKSHAKEAFDKAKEMGLGLAVLEVEFFPCDPEEYLTRSRKNMAAWE